MLTESIQLLLDTVKESVAADNVATLAKTRLINIGGVLTHVEVPPDSRCPNVRTVSDMIPASVRWGADGTLFHDDDRVILVVDDSDRRDVVTMGLEISPQYRTLLRAELFNHIELMRLLCREFIDCVDTSFTWKMEKRSFSSK